MTRFLLSLALCSASAFAQAGQFTLSPASLAVTQGNQSVEILVSYQPSEWIGDALVNLRLNLDHLGWVQAQKVASSSPDYVTNCALHRGVVFAVVNRLGNGPLPAGTPIPLCRLRVRAFKQAIEGVHTITATADAQTPFLEPADATANNVRVVVR